MGKLPDDARGHTRGPKDSRGVVVSRIIEVARGAFAEQGYDATSMRSVAIAAQVDPRLVGYYFGSKQALLEACLVPPPGFLERVTEVVTTDLDARGEALVQSLLLNWEDPASASILRSIILIAAQHPVALERLRLIVTGSLVGAVATKLADEERTLRGGLVATQMLGLAMTRYVWRIEPIASLSSDDVVAIIAPTIQRYLDGELRAAS
jgi:AcrR family transcriptional regulator